MDADRPTSPAVSRADRFGGPVFFGHAEFVSSGFFVRKCVLKSPSGKVATVRGNDVRFPNGTRLSFETHRAGIHPRHGRTALIDLPGNIRASAEWVASDHYFQVHGDDAGYAVERGGKRHLWQMFADGVVVEFDHHRVDARELVPVTAVITVRTRMAKATVRCRERQRGLRRVMTPVARGAR